MKQVWSIQNRPGLLKKYGSLQIQKSTAENHHAIKNKQKYFVRNKFCNEESANRDVDDDVGLMTHRL